MRKRSKTTSSETSALPTLMDHLRELQGRLFSTVFIFVIIAAAAYPFFDKIAAFLMAPLKPGQELVYLTPGGAFSFIIKVCAYIGIVGSLPVIIFHLYRFIMPAVKKTLLRTVLGYTIASLFLAAIGVAFAYYISLPASLYFLTGFNLNHIDPMLTIDSYFSFVMTYMLAGALLFQLPLIMLIINSATPLTPAKLMKAQGKIVLGSFIVAAIISPTPDALNQTLLASPMVVMYQVGIVMIWWKHRARKKAGLREVKAKVQSVTTSSRPVVPRPAASQPLPVASAKQVVARSTKPSDIKGSLSSPAHRPVVAMDMIRVPKSRPAVVAVPARTVSPSLALPLRTPQQHFNGMGMRSLDGVIKVRPSV